MVPAASHRIPRVPWYSRTPLEDQSSFAYWAVTTCGGPFQGPSASGWVGNFHVIRQDDLPLLEIPRRNRVRPLRHGRVVCFLFGLPVFTKGFVSPPSLQSFSLPEAPFPA